MKRTTTLIIISFVIFTSTYVHAFPTETHEVLSEKAAFRSTLNDFLVSELNISEGLNKVLDGLAIFDWIGEGSIREDDGIRPLNHFHNPLRSWDEPTSFGFSSVCWAQATNCQGGAAANDFSWQNARQSYYDGLTATTQAEREEKLALAFKTLGHQAHLIQDAAVPAHSRNDNHFFFDGFESYVDTTRRDNPPVFNIQLTGATTSYDNSILALTTVTSAPIPIARIIDTTDADQALFVPSAGTNIGMAEYSNPNFLSDDTIFIDFIFPRQGSLGTSFPVNGVTYYPKDFDGESPIGHFVAEDASGFYLSQGGTPDPLIFKDYAVKLQGSLPIPQPNRLLPRAIGYSSGLINYFIRGRLEIANVEVTR